MDLHKAFRKLGKFGDMGKHATIPGKEGVIRMPGPESMVDTSFPKAWHLSQDSVRFRTVTIAEEPAIYLVNIFSVIAKAFPIFVFDITRCSSPGLSG
jgi:hypothetical protein